MHDAAGEGRPLEVKVVGQHTHTAIPKTPENFNGGVALGIVLLVLALVLNVSLGWMQSRSRVLRHGT